MVYSYMGIAADTLWRYTGLSKAKGLIESVAGSNKSLSSNGCSHCNPKETAAIIRTLTNMPGLSGCGSGFIRLAGISGAIAVGLGAYGAHVFAKENIADELKQVYDRANRYHLIHTLALLAVPLTRRPLLTGSLLTLGMLMFCGSCYFHALTGNKDFRMATPFGGVLLMVGWISMAI